MTTQLSRYSKHRKHVAHRGDHEYTSEMLILKSMLQGKHLFCLLPTSSRMPLPAKLPPLQNPNSQSLIVKTNSSRYRSVPKTRGSSTHSAQVKSARSAARGSGCKFYSFDVPQGLGAHTRRCASCRRAGSSVRVTETCVSGREEEREERKRKEGCNVE
jgi:hypothetical protein